MKKLCNEKCSGCTNYAFSFAQNENVCSAGKDGFDNCFTNHLYTSIINTENEVLNLTFNHYFKNGKLGTITFKKLYFSAPIKYFLIDIDTKDYIYENVYCNLAFRSSNNDYVLKCYINLREDKPLGINEVVNIKLGNNTSLKKFLRSKTSDWGDWY